MSSDQPSSDQPNKNEENNKKNQIATIVLGVFIHCDGCRDDVIRSLRGFQGVEGVEVDTKNHKVTVKGKEADPTKVAERLRKKSGKHVELIHPKPKAEPKKEEKKRPQEPVVIEALLKIYIHCEGCAKEVKYCVHKMEGVQTVDADMAKNQVTVKGTMDPKKLVEFVGKRSGKNVDLVKQSVVSGKGSEKNVKNGKESDAKSSKKKGEKGEKAHNYTELELVYAPQLFSDENPNACSVM